LFAVLAGGVHQFDWAIYSLLCRFGSSLHP
jgi:hypothetical protein